MTKRAIVVNGNKAYRHRVFALRSARIVKSWDTDEYLRTPLSVIRKEVEDTRRVSNLYDLWKCDK